VANERRQRQKEHEAAKREAAKKAASRKEIRRRVFIALGMGGIVVLLLVSVNLLGGEELEVPERYLDFQAQPTACGADTPTAASLERWPEVADQALEAGTVITATIVTSCGEMTLELDPTTAPASVNAFVFLARQGAYDGTVFHFVDPALRIEGGDPEANGTGSHFMDGRRITVRIPNEFPGDSFEMDRGVVGFSGDATTRGTGLFIVTADDSPLSNRLNVIGRITAGLETLDRMAEVDRKAPPGSGARSAPAETIYIESITIADPTE
jgi:peptidyl-prolyl cis-trans isomerase B (cyclophilin B)